MAGVIGCAVPKTALMGLIQEIPEEAFPVSKDLVVMLMDMVVKPDIDADGDLDIVVTQNGRRALLFRNDQQLEHHWLRVTLEGTQSNRDAIGSIVELTAGGTTQRRSVMPTRSYLSQVELPVTFGLGDADSIDALRITWPDGQLQEVSVDRIDTSIRVTQPANGHEHHE